MTPDQYIKGMAEEWYPKLEGFFTNGQSHDIPQQEKRETFSAGASAMIPIMEGFANFCAGKYIYTQNGYWFEMSRVETNYTTQQLLELYFSTLK